MCTQPRVSVSPIGAKLFDGGPKLRSMIKVPQMAELVHDDVVKDVEGREHQSPRERDGAAAAAGPPTRRAISDPKRHRVRLRQVSDQCCRDTTGLLAVPALHHPGRVFEVRCGHQNRVVGAHYPRATGLAERQRQGSAVAPDNVGAFEAEVALLEASRLAGNPFAVCRDQFAACALAAAGRQDQLDTGPSLGNQAHSARACRPTHGHAHSIDDENLHRHRITTAPDGALESSISLRAWFGSLTTAHRRARAGIVHP